VNLPEMDIKVAHHFPNDGQIDTVIMAEYLSKVSTAFKATLANPSSASWPAENVSAGYIKGAGLIGFVAETPGSIGYVELERARHSPLTYGAVKNSDGDFVTASQESLTAASALVSPMIQTRMDFRISLTNAPGKKSYPIASFMWLLLYEDSKEEKKNEIMKDFLKWVLTDGQKLALKLGYPALPDDLTKVELQRLGASTRP
jgi:phosphate transport system substrate-binding protein